MRPPANNVRKKATTCTWPPRHALSRGVNAVELTFSPGQIRGSGASAWMTSSLPAWQAMLKPENPFLTLCHAYSNAPTQKSTAPSHNMQTCNTAWPMHHRAGWPLRRTR